MVVIGKQCTDTFSKCNRVVKTCVREILLPLLEISRHQSLFQQIQWIWQEELLYTMIPLLLKINWASFSPDGFLDDNYRIVYTYSWMIKVGEKHNFLLEVTFFKSSA